MKDKEEENIMEESIFEESIINSSFSGSGDQEDDNTESYYSSSEYEDEESDQIDEYEPRGFFNLRGLFDEDAVDQRMSSSSLDFEEIPDDIDIDEPIEVEKLSRAGRIMNFVVTATLIIFSLLVLSFIINAGLVIGAVLSANYQSSLFINITGLDTTEATINATIKTEVANFGRFIVGDLDTTQPIEAHVYLSNDEIPKHEDAILSIEYQNADPKAEPLRFNGGIEGVFHLEGIKMRLNPDFDSSRLSGFIEPQIDGKFHDRYPRKMVIHYAVSFVIHSFWVPIPYDVKMFTEVPLDKIDPVLEKIKAEKMKEFDFNPKFVEMTPIDDGHKVKLHVRQPIPKFYAPPLYEISVQIPKLDFDVRQFTQKNPETTPEIQSLISNSNHLTRLSIRPFRLMMGKDSDPNILDIDAILTENSAEGLSNVLRAIRDGQLGTLAFLLLSADFKAFKNTAVPVIEDNSEDGESESADSAERFKPKPLPGCTFAKFMESFWGRQAYPVPLDGVVSEIPSVPEMYNFSKDFALHVEFKGLTKLSGENPAQVLAFRISANTHYVITKYKLPLLMLSGTLPALNFKALLKHKKHSEMASFSLTHVNKNVVDPLSGIHPLGKEIVFDLLVDLKNDLTLLSHFVMKLLRVSQIPEKLVKDHPESVNHLVGEFFNYIEGIEISADSSKGLWASQVASVFDLKLSVNNGKIDFLYSRSGLPVIPATKDIAPVTVYSEEEEDKIIKSLNDLLKVDPSIVAPADIETTWISRIEEIKKTVREADLLLYKSSTASLDLALIAKNDLLRNGSKKPLVTSSNEEECPRKKLQKARDLLIKRIALKQAAPFSYGSFNNSLVSSINSDKRAMNLELLLGLHRLERSFEDHISFEWKAFSLSFEDSKDTQLVSLDFDRGSFKLSLSDASRIYSTKVALEALKVNIGFGPVDEEMSVSTWMASFRNFYKALLGASEEIFLPFNFGLHQGDDLSIKHKCDLLTFKLAPVNNNASPTTSSAAAVKAGNAGFFDNLTRSHFDFIGYGFYQLIFHAILPNPDECPEGSIIYNVELNLPPSTAFLFASAGTAILKDPACVATVNTSQPLRIWTQIIDGVLCNMYAVADGLAEQKRMIQAKISRERADDIIKSFEAVLTLRRKSAGIKALDYSSSSTANQDPLIHFKDLVDSISPSVELDKIPASSRIGLITAVPVTLEIVDFERMIKTIDALGEQKHVKISSDDPLYYTDLTSSSMIKSTSLLNNLLSALGSNFPIEFNSSKMPAKSTVQKIIHVSDESIVLDVNTISPSPHELTVKTRIFMPNRIKATTKNNDVKTENASSYVVYESLLPEKRFQYPVIRWGDTVLHFVLPKFSIELKISSGDLKITNDGESVLFDSLVDFRIEFTIRSEGKDKDIFQVSSLRQVFKRCQDFVRNTQTSYGDKGQIIKTTSTVSYNNRHKFHYLGRADIESFFSLQGVIIRRMFSTPDSSSSKDKNFFDDPKDDPTYMDFGLLISLGKNRTEREEFEDSYSSSCISRLPHLKLPCFFTNICSAEQLSYSSFNKRGLLKNATDNIPVKLHVRNTFRPLAASIAAGFSTFLPIFHMETYPKSLEWRLTIPPDQVIGMDMNGQGMFYGKTEGPLEIVKSADIPYPNGLESIALNSTSKKKKIKSESSESSSEGDEIISTTTKQQQQLPDLVDYSNQDAFERDFYPHQMKEDFTDEVIIPLSVQVPDTLPDVLRKMLWPMFFIPFTTCTLHPPLLNVESRKPVELTHAPIAIALSDEFVFKTSDGFSSIKPSLLARLFAAFIEESSGPGLEVHSQKPPSAEPSSFRFHYAVDRNPNIMVVRNIWPLLKEYTFQRSGSLIHAIIWVQFPWPMGSIGFDFGASVHGKIFLTNENDQVLLEGAMTQHHMIGKVARIRVDLLLPHDTLPKALHIASTFLQKYAGYASDFSDIPLRCEFLVGDNFVAETEIIIPERAILAGPKNRSGISSGHKVNLAHTTTNIDSLMSRYKTAAPDAIACVYNRHIPATEFERQQNAWSQLDLSLTRVYYGKIKGIKPGEAIQLFLQLRTFGQMPVCGWLEGFSGLAVKIEYIKPTSKPLEILFNPTTTKCNPPTILLPAKFDKITSVYLVENIALPCTGRYKLAVALIKDNSTNGKDLKKLTFTQIKFTEIYVQNSR